MTIDNVFVMVEEVHASAIWGWLCALGVIVGIAGLFTSIALWAKDYVRGIAAFGLILVSAAIIVATPFLAGSGADKEAAELAPAVSSEEAVEGWLLDVHGLTITAGSAPGKDALEGFLENRVVMATDTAGEVHAVQLLPLSDRMLGEVDGKPVRAGEGGYYLLDPETGQEFGVSEEVEER